MKFHFFDPASDVEVSRRNLPHWEQRDAYYFLTWRTADSIPATVLDQWLRERGQWLTDHGIDPAQEDWQRDLEKLPEAEHREFYRRYTERWHRMLDACHGECVLRDPNVSEIVAENLQHQNGHPYELEAWVVMPNHVHVLVGVPGRGALKTLCRNWKNYTAKRINQRLNRVGQFWQWESFDHLVRSEASLEKFRRYILDNPGKAKLSEGSYRMWSKGQQEPRCAPK
ncbi:Transposase IS200 like [Prosthecobacter debontii]|uniref:Transposase IS200 like n=1 Tax=Prosthecobacter debontii TaxID=48467 RepID=A0A1T4YLW7_9BACT|nr:transposase [Prosthecobacter debontii]SKB02817.1 Transposase IS200 like [Prosthecobacter debontii]